MTTARVDLADAPPLLRTRDLLFGDAAASAELVAALRERDLLERADDAGRLTARHVARTVRGQVAAAVKDVTDVDVGDLLVIGWRKRRDLRAAAARTLASPGSRELVGLASHTVKAAHRPAVDLLVHGHRVARVTLDLALDLGVECLVAVVQDGALVEVTQGDLTVKGRLALDGVPVLVRSRKVPLPDWFRVRGRLVLALPAPREPAEPASGMSGGLPPGTDAADANAPDTSPPGTTASA